jgi:hypothetical protein
MPVTEPAQESVLDRLVLVLAVAASAAWIGFAVLYMRGVTGGLRSLSPTEAAALFAGIGGPLAGLWLFVALNEQRRRLSLMTQALREVMGQHRHTLQIAETQTRALVAFQAQAERAQAGETRRFVLQDLAASVAVLAERLGVIRREDLDVTWARFGSGDAAAFVQPFLAFAVSHPDISTRMAEAVARDPLAAAAVQAFVRRFESLTASAADKLVRDVLEEGPLGRAYRLFKPASGTGSTASTASAAGAHQSDLFRGDPLASQLADLSQRLDAVAKT